MNIISLLKSINWNLGNWLIWHKDWSKQLAGIGSGCRLAPGIQIAHPDKLFIERGVIIEKCTIINASAGVRIGHHSIISSHCSIWTGNHRYYDGITLPYDHESLNDPVEIGPCVWIGHKALVVPGVTIGEGAVVGMGSVVTRDVPPLAIVGGNPAQVIKMRNSDHYYNLKKIGAFFEATESSSRK